VGKRRGLLGKGHHAPDHPHVRGEKAWRLLHGGKKRGSSPRAWGKGGLPFAVAVQKRIIPTCVGKRKEVCADLSWNADHPHVRGEKVHRLNA